VVIIDTDVLLLAFAFHRDERQAVNTTFLDQVKRAEPATTIFNLMELLGQLSFNLSPERLAAWQSWLVEAFNLDIIQPSPEPHQDPSEFFRTQVFDHPFAKMRAQRMAFVDALVLDLADRTPGVECFITWNARHFKSKSALTVLTPTEYLAQNV